MGDKEKELEKFEINFFGNKLWELILEQTKTITLVAQLTIALLIIASFSEKIITPTNLPILKILIAILLSLIPIMIADYIIQLNDGIETLEKKLKFKNKKKTRYKKILDGSNYIYVLMIIIIINVIIYLIIQNYIWSSIIMLIHNIAIGIFLCSKHIK